MDYTTQSTLPQPRRNPNPQCVPPTKLQDFITYTTRHPISNYLIYQHLSIEHTVFLTPISVEHPISNYLTYQHLLVEHIVFLTPISMCINHEIFKRQIHRINGGMLNMTSYKLLIKIKPRVWSNFVKMSLLIDTKHVLWLIAILKLLA